jgi:GntR family transcriptional regulator
VVHFRRTRVEHVRDELIADLLDGRYPIGAKLPNEQELAERFAVSRATVREAVRGLHESGYLARRHGSGTYVTGTPRQHTLDATLSYLDMIRGSGMEPGLKLLSTTTRGPVDDEAVRLALAPGEQVVCVERIRTADGHPVVYSRDRLPRRLLGAGADTVSLDASLYGVLARAGVEVRQAVATLLPVLADAQVGPLLGVEAGSPLLHLDQTDFDRDGRPVMLSAEWHVPDVLPLRITRRPTQPSRRSQQ